MTRCACVVLEPVTHAVLGTAAWAGGRAIRKRSEIDLNDEGGRLGGRRDRIETQGAASGLSSSVENTVGQAIRGTPKVATSALDHEGPSKKCRLRRGAL